MAYIKVSNAEKRKMYRCGGYRERSAMDNAACYCSKKWESRTYPDCIKVVKKDGSTCIWSKKRQAWIN